MVLMSFSLVLLVSYQLQLANGNDDELNLLQAIIEAALDFLLFLDFIFQLLCLLDEQIEDIPYDTSLNVAYCCPKRFTMIASFSNDDEAKCLMNFNKLELTSLIHHFNLPPKARVQLPGDLF
jgi:hypothetical protein